MKLGKILVKIYRIGLCSYACAKMVEKTGMQIPEILLMKDSFKVCEKYYSRKLSIFLKTKFGKRKLQQVKLVKSEGIDPIIKSKLKGIHGQASIVPGPIMSTGDTMCAISKKSLFEGTHLQHE